MSAGNLSRIENGEQGPPADETIERLAAALRADIDELLRAAGRLPTGAAFEQQVLDELKALRADVAAGFERIERHLKPRR